MKNNKKRETVNNDNNGCTRCNLYSASCFWIKDKKYYHPKDIGYEKQIKDRLERLKNRDE
mgnify:CR=1 FL=1